MNLKQLIEKFEKASNQIDAGCVEFLEHVAVDVIAELQNNMIGEHLPQWPDLADSTVEQKTRLGLGKGGDPSSPLYATGAYSASIEYRIPSPRSMELGTDDEKAKYLEYGTYKMPPRPLFVPSGIAPLRRIISEQGRLVIMRVF